MTHNPHTNPYTNQPVTVHRAADRATLPRRSVTHHAAVRIGHGDSVRWVRQIRGVTYTFDLVTMPTGEIRIHASAFNGYAGGMQFGCAWTPVRSITIAPPAPVLHQRVWYTPFDGQRAGRIVRFGAIIGGAQQYYVAYRNDSGEQVTVYTSLVRPRVTHVSHPFKAYDFTDARQGCSVCGEALNSLYANHADVAPPATTDPFADIRDQIAADADAILTGTTAGCDKCTDPRPHDHTGYHGMPIHRAARTVAISMRLNNGVTYEIEATYRREDGVIRAEYRSNGPDETVRATVAPWSPDWRAACAAVGMDPSTTQISA